MDSWHIKSHNILLSTDGANTNSVQFNGIWSKFLLKSNTIHTLTYHCRYIDSVTASGAQGNHKSGEIVKSEGIIHDAFNKIQAAKPVSRLDTLMGLSSVRNLFPIGVSNFNNLLLNIKSFNAAHFQEHKNYLQTSFLLGTTAPLLGSTLANAASEVTTSSIVGTLFNLASGATDTSFSGLYNNLINRATQKPVVIMDFDKEDDRLRDTFGHVIRPFRQHIIDKRETNISENDIFTVMMQSISGLINNYNKPLKR